MKKHVGRTIVFDFDGVIHEGYRGWRDGTIYGEINLELLKFIKELQKEFYVVISSNRPAKQIVEKLREVEEDGKNGVIEEIGLKYELMPMKVPMFWNEKNIVGVTNMKAVGIAYIDDRGFKYDDSIAKNLDYLYGYLKSIN